MSFRRCPGSVAFSQPKIELMRCPNCGSDAEIWSDETEGTCTQCHQTVMRTGLQSCVDWCKYARECLGEEKHTKYENAKAAMRKEALVRAAAEGFAWDERDTEQARTLVGRAEQHLARRQEADPNVVLATIVLRYATKKAPTDMSEERRDSEVQTILEDLNYPQGFVRQVCGLVAIPTPAHTEDANLAIIRDVLSSPDSTVNGGLHRAP